eukprot:5125979-Prymnesium_polylepis.1
MLGKRDFAAEKFRLEQHACSWSGSAENFHPQMNPRRISLVGVVLGAGHSCNVACTIPGTA